jgi:hypothetical protein
MKTPLDNALNLPVSLANEVFKSKAYEGFKKGKENDYKLVKDVLERLNGVIIGTNNICKTIANCIKPR